MNCIKTLGMLFTYIFYMSVQHLLFSPPFQPFWFSPLYNRHNYSVKYIQNNCPVKTNGEQTINKQILTPTLKSFPVLHLL